MSYQEALGFRLSKWTSTSASSMCIAHLWSIVIAPYLEGQS